ncbi:MAG: hypothetical protein U0K57_10290, partial [Lachnospiraceae bacterium]|nr:hypothetical protein [Lachnospiraceae bacterium]
SKQKKLEMFESMKKVISAIPYENGDYLMADFVGEADIMYGNSPEEPCATIEFSLVPEVLEHVGPSYIEDALEGFTKIVSQSLKIPGDHIFALLYHAPIWALNGVNIEQTFLKFN